MNMDKPQGEEKRGLGGADLIWSCDRGSSAALRSGGRDGDGDGRGGDSQPVILPK